MRPTPYGGPGCPAPAWGAGGDIRGQSPIGGRLLLGFGVGLGRVHIALTKACASREVYSGARSKTRLLVILSLVRFMLFSFHRAGARSRLTARGGTRQRRRGSRGGGAAACMAVSGYVSQVLFQEAGSRLRQREEPRRRAFGREAGFDINGGTSRQWSTRGRRGMGMRRLLASRRHGAHDGIASSCADARVVCVSALARACSMSHSGPKCWQHRVVRPVECP